MTVYATVQQMRDEGVTIAQASDPQLTAKIARCSQMIERWTGRWFYPKSLLLLIDGKGKDILQLGPPIISIDEVKILGQGSLYITSSDEVVALDEVRVYNRHLTEQLQDPDDRNNPKVQWLTFQDLGRRMPEVVPIAIFPRGVQNIQVTGTFGYTDYDGTPNGKTPDLINVACMMMVVMDLAPLVDMDSRFEAMMRGRLTALRTRDQSISWAATANLRPLGTGGNWTGNPQVDGIIASFRRPPTLGAV